MAGAGAVGGTGGIVGSQDETDLISLLASPALGSLPDQVPGWAGLLVGPLYRGAEVELK